MRMLVLGSGKEAKALSYDFIKHGHEVTIASRSEPTEILSFLKSKRACWQKLDASDLHAAAKAMKGYDVAASAVPYHLNAGLAKAAVQARCNFIDLGGNVDVVRQEFALSAKAKKQGISIIPDCGLAPGLVSDLAALGLQDLGRADSVKMRVGGLPQHPRPPLNYMIVFSIHGLINEYIGDAEVIRNYRFVKRPGMSDVETLTFSGIGKMEAFQTSGGTSTLPQTYGGKIQELDYKTIRFPGHAEKIKFLMDMGLTSSEKRLVAGQQVNPRAVLEELFREKLSFKDKDMVLLKVILENKKQKLTYTLVDKEQGGLTAMMRCTGFPAAAIAEMVAQGEIAKKGTLKHENDLPVSLLYDRIKQRGLNIKRRLQHK